MIRIAQLTSTAVLLTELTRHVAVGGPRGSTFEPSAPCLIVLLPFRVGTGEKIASPGPRCAGPVPPAVPQGSVTGAALRGVVQPRVNPPRVKMDDGSVHNIQIADRLQAE